MLVAKDERSDAILESLPGAEKETALLLIAKLEVALEELPRGLARELAITALRGVQHWVLRT